MRVAIAILIVVLAGLAQPSRRASFRTSTQETVYASHTCPDGHSWYMISSDSESITIECYAEDGQ